MITRDWFVKQLLLPGITGAFCNTINTHPALAKRSRALYWPFIVQAIFPNQSSTTKIHSEKVNLSTWAECSGTDRRCNTHFALICPLILPFLIKLHSCIRIQLYLDVFALKSVYPLPQLPPIQPANSTLVEKSIRGDCKPNRSGSTQKYT